MDIVGMDERERKREREERRGKMWRERGYRLRETEGRENYYNSSMRHRIEIEMGPVSSSAISLVNFLLYTF